MIPRDAFVHGLRQLADALVADPLLPLPVHGTSMPLVWTSVASDVPDVDLDAFIRATGARPAAPWDSQYVEFRGELAGLRVSLVALREDVEPPAHELAGGEWIAEEKRTALADEDRDDALACDLAERAAS